MMPFLPSFHPTPQPFTPRPLTWVPACHPPLPPQVEWLNPADATKGFRYLYLSPEDHASLTARSPATVLKADRIVTEAGEERYQLTGDWELGECGGQSWLGGCAHPVPPSTL